MDYSYEILDLLEQYHMDTQAALAGENSPQCLYAFSPLREMLFEWVEIPKTARVLQIGSDYGSYTGLLAARAKEVVVMDSRDENLEVNRLRHGHHENLKFLRGEILDAAAGKASYKEYKPRKTAKKQTESPVFAESFDFVLISGLFEQYKKEDAEAILKAAAGFLKSGGTLYAAAENESGIRYWMGAARPATAFLEVEFRGLFEKLVKEHGGSYLQYYPTPDYRYPAAIYSDNHLPATGDVTNISARLDGPGLGFGSEEEAMAKACQNGQFVKFANSFLGAYQKG